MEEILKYIKFIFLLPYGTLKNARIRIIESPLISPFAVHIVHHRL